ncbi:hypothetical protein CcrC1_gp311 [Caulobacter phage C1]|nr:hypothetical protein CcrC1_gp311 [Caulobacter phage C1]UTU08540.1 hypothetical protein CcrC2_gp312 [Caulobacter phage C2]UTU09056.1 hypothetical protein CcrJ4_gp307 [Caulobacter phage J4]UTU10173.1 hypothetical protein CcrRB23_gp311 [Caulobacter phage RB23]WGN97207.1 hypothetical protein [Bertelyvirus sp.]
MPTTRLRSPEMVDKIIADFKKTQNLDATAKKFNASVSGIRAVLRCHAPDLLSERRQAQADKS